MTTDTEIQEAANAHYVSRFSEIERLMNLWMQAQSLGHQEWEDSMMERIEQMPLSVQCVAIYPHRESCEWEILLGTGGPADRVLVVTDFAGEVESASYQHQDWFTPWTDAFGQESEIVERFASFFWFSDVKDILDAIR